MKKTMMLPVVFLSFALWAVAAPISAGPDGKEKADKDAIQGTWVWVSIEVGGKKTADEEFKAKKAVTVIRDGTIAVRSKGQEKQRGKYQLDPTKSPKHIDITIEHGGQAVVLKGVYRLDGDTLTLCYGRPNDERPKTFVTQAGSEVGVLRLKREKE